MKKHNKKAFTLVELLVTIAIIAILAVVSVVGYSAFTQKARDSVAQQELSQVITLITAEDTENGDTYNVSAEGLTFKETQTTSGFDISKILGDEYTTDLAELKGTFEFTWDTSKTDTVITKIAYTKDGGKATWDFTKRLLTNH